MWLMAAQGFRTTYRASLFYRKRISQLSLFYISGWSSVVPGDLNSSRVLTLWFLIIIHWSVSLFWPGSSGPEDIGSSTSLCSRASMFLSCGSDISSNLHFSFTACPTHRSRLIRQDEAADASGKRKTWRCNVHILISAVEHSSHSPA